METDETRDRRKKNIVELTRCSVSDYRAMPKLPLRVMADNIRSMYNVGAIFRTADAFCVEEVILAGISGCPPHQEISKTALGAEESVAWRHVGDAVAEARRLQQEGMRPRAGPRQRASAGFPCGARMSVSARGRK